MVVFDFLKLKVPQRLAKPVSSTIEKQGYGFAKELRTHFVARPIPLELVQGYVICSLGPLPFETDSDKLTLVDSTAYFESALLMGRIVLSPLKDTWQNSVAPLNVSARGEEQESAQLIFRHLVANKHLCSPREARVLGKVLKRRSWWSRSFRTFNPLISKEKVQLLLQRLRRRSGYYP